MQWYKHENGLAKILNDEVRMITSLNMETEADIMYIDINSHKLDLSNKYTQRSKPIENQMDLTENEYREFLSTFSLSLNWIKNFMQNEFFNGGIFFPYNISEF